MGGNYCRYLAASYRALMKKSAASPPADMTQMGEIGWRVLEGLNEKLIRDPTGKQVLIDILVMANIQGDPVRSPSGAEVIHLSL